MTTGRLPRHRDVNGGQLLHQMLGAGLGLGVGSLRTMGRPNACTHHIV